MGSDRTPVSVVLGGGGAKGFVHIGVLEELVARDFDIVAIFGTSIGSIVGALFAYHAEFHHAGEPRDKAQQLAVESVKDLLLTTDFLRLADLNFFSPFRRGPLKSSKMKQWLDMQLAARNSANSIRFRDLTQIDLHVTVTDALTGKSIVANRDVSKNTFVSSAVRASMSIQGVFREESMDLNGSTITCWDGGVTGNCRFDLSMREYPAILTVASSVTYRGDPRALPNGFATGPIRALLIGDRSADFWLRRIEDLTEEMLGSARANLVVVRPDLAGVKTTSFGIGKTLRQTLFENGRLATGDALDARQETPPR